MSGPSGPSGPRARTRRQKKGGGIFLLHEVVTELAMENHCFWSVNQRYINVQVSIAMLNELPEGRFYGSYNMLQIVRWVEVTIVKSTYNYGAPHCKVSDVYGNVGYI